MTEFLFSKNIFKGLNQEFLNLVCNNRISKLSGFPNLSAKAFFVSNVFYECNFEKLIVALNDKSSRDEFLNLLHNFGVKDVENFSIIDNPTLDKGLDRKNSIFKLNLS